MLKMRVAKFFGPQRRKFQVFGIFLASLISLGVIVRVFYPLEASALTARLTLMNNGIVQVEKGGVKGYLRDRCEQRDEKAIEKLRGPSTTSDPCACVALVHGLGDDALTWKKILMEEESEWAKLGLTRPLRLLAVDLPGSGMSAAPQDVSEYRVRKQAEKLRPLLASLCPHWLVVGNSLGGWVSTWLALDWSAGVNRLLLLDSAGLKLEKEVNGPGLLVDPTIDSMKEFQKKAYFHPRPISDRDWKVIVQKVKAGNSKAVLQAQVPADDLDLVLPTLHQPTMLVWGQEDHIIPLSIGIHMRSLIPGVLWRDVPRCGHLLQKECPAVVLRSIVDMINYGQF